MNAPGQSAVITGIGVVAPSGIGAEAHWSSTLRGEVKVAPVTRFATPTPAVTPAGAAAPAAVLAGEVDGFQPEDHLDPRLIVQTDRWTWLALTAAGLALDDADYRPSDHDPYDTAAILASGSGGNEFGQREIGRLWSQGRRAVGAYQSIAWFYAASTGQISILHGLKGPSGVIVSGEAGGLDCLGEARRAIRRGTRAVVAGATEAAVAPYAMTCYATSGMLTAGSTPEEGYRPFSRHADGYAPGEGGALFVVEDAAAAHERGRRGYGRIAGYAATHDAHHDRRPAPEPDPLVRAMRRALDDAGLTSDDVDVVFADGMGTREHDLLEARALGEVFGDRLAHLPVTAPHSLGGRLCAGTPALNVATALLAMRDGVVPPVGNLTDPDPAYGLHLITGEPRGMPTNVIMINARGYGGFNSCLILTSTS
ncbi:MULTISPECIES: beta-ketoacyl synthase N-terminal-like domain-containing protein [Protofrankia]|uniref:Beta-ketoacyl-acyl-carrier-protein synthase II n=1 Tax=Candidatus Protofrankia datiscae TaxID=2716812 RepID=F8B0I4_9ACTN|nr:MULTISPECIES: beta-ketoacyl synthase N-terminal-like domain-containing protein [Protofrankia]AEH09733.1 Beta-ketoacyl-acyl-carrier-protein synthase II [Candidatus Protofrankia datiscae]